MSFLKSEIYGVFSGPYSEKGKAPYLGTFHAMDDWSWWLLTHGAEAATRGILWKKSVLRNFTKSSGNHLCKSLFFNKKDLKKTLAQVFSYEFCEIFKNTFFTEHFWTTASDGGCSCFQVLPQFIVYRSWFVEDFKIYLIWLLPWIFWKIYIFTSWKLNIKY